MVHKKSVDERQPRPVKGKPASAKSNKRNPSDLVNKNRPNWLRAVVLPLALTLMAATSYLYADTAPAKQWKNRLVNLWQSTQLDKPFGSYMGQETALEAGRLPVGPRPEYQAVSETRPEPEPQLETMKDAERVIPKENSVESGDTPELSGETVPTTSTPQKFTLEQGRKLLTTSELEQLPVPVKAYDVAGISTKLPAIEPDQGPSSGPSSDAAAELKPETMTNNLPKIATSQGSAPLDKQVTRQNRPYNLIITFAFDSAALMNEATQQLDEIAGYFPNSDLRAIRVTGYADEQGNRQYNLNLSRRRAGG